MHCGIQLEMPHQDPFKEYSQLTFLQRNIWKEISFIQGPVVQSLKKLLAKHDVKISVLKYDKYIDIFYLKMWVLSSFCIAKASHSFAAKISMYLKIS